MKKFDKILEGLKNKSPLPLLFENGYTPETIKSEILNDFARYFTDLKSLEKYALNYMVADWINFMRVENGKRVKSAYGLNDIILTNNCLVDKLSADLTPYVLCGI